MRRRSGTVLVGRLTILALWLLLQGAAATDRAPQQREQPAAAAAHHHPFLRHQPDPLRGTGGPLPFDANQQHFFKLTDAWAGKDEREVVVLPVAEEAAAAAPPVCPRNARFSFCAVEPSCAPTCEDRIASANNGGAPVLKACNRMCYQRCECLPDHLLLEGYCVPDAVCDRVRDARTPVRKREAIEEALEGFDPDTDQLIPTPDSPRRPGAGAGGGIGIRPRPGVGGPIDDINDFLDSVTGGLWPDGGPAPAAGGKAEEGRGERLRYEWELQQQQQQQGQSGDSSMHIKYVVKEKGQQHGGEAAEEKEHVVVTLESKQQVLGTGDLGPEH